MLRSTTRLLRQCATSLAPVSRGNCARTLRFASGSVKDWQSEETYAKTRLPIDEASTLPGAVYHDEDFAKLEQDRIWKSSWVAVAELADISESGDVRPANVGGAGIIITNWRGKIHAFHNVCRHRGAQLVDEPCKKRNTILCPYHRWGYALTGKLMGTPAFDADEMGKAIPEHIREKFNTNHVKDFDKKDMGLYPIEVDTALGMVFVNVNGDAPPLKEWLGDLLTLTEKYEEALAEDLVVYHQKQYKVDSNWKLLIENFLEYYHLPAVHPALCDVSGVDEHDRRQGKGMYMGFGTFPLRQGGTALDPGRLPPFRGISEPDTESAYHICIFPNVFFSLYPDNFFRVILHPDGPNRTVENASMMSHKGALEHPDRDKFMAEIYAFWDNVNNEDINIVEKVQIGTASEEYKGGRFSFRFEETLHRFQNMVIDKQLGGEHKYRIPEGDGPDWIKGAGGLNGKSE